MTTLPALPPSPAPSGTGSALPALPADVGSGSEGFGAFAGLLGPAGMPGTPEPVVPAPVLVQGSPDDAAGPEAPSDGGPAQVGPTAAQIIAAAQVTPVGPMLASAPRLVPSYDATVVTVSPAPLSRGVPAASAPLAAAVPAPGPAPVPAAVPGAPTDGAVPVPDPGLHAGSDGQVPPAPAADARVVASPASVSEQGAAEPGPARGPDGTGSSDRGPAGPAAEGPATSPTASATGTGTGTDTDGRSQQAGTGAGQPAGSQAPAPQPTATQPTAVAGLAATGPVAGTAAPEPASGPGAGTAADPVAGQVFPEVTRLVSRGDGTRRITLQLSPEALGDVRVVLTVRNGEVQVRMSGGEQAQQALLSGAPELHRLLDVAGATSSQIQVGSQSSTSLDQHPPQRDAHGQGALHEEHQGHRTAGTRDGDTSARDGAPRGTHPHPATNPGTRTRTTGVDVTM